MSPVKPLVHDGLEDLIAKVASVTERLESLLPPLGPPIIRIGGLEHFLLSVNLAVAEILTSPDICACGQCSSDTSEGENRVQLAIMTQAANITFLELLQYAEAEWIQLQGGGNAGIDTAVYLEGNNTLFGLICSTADPQPLHASSSGEVCKHYRGSDGGSSGGYKEAQGRVEDFAEEIEQRLEGKLRSMMNDFIGQTKRDALEAGKGAKAWRKQVRGEAKLELAQVKAEAEERIVVIQAALEQNRLEMDRQRFRLDAQDVVIRDMAEKLKKHQVELAVARCSQSAPTAAPPRRKAYPLPVKPVLPVTDSIGPMQERLAKQEREIDTQRGKAEKVEEELREEIEDLKRELSILQADRKDIGLAPASSSGGRSVLPSTIEALSRAVISSASFSTMTAGLLTDLTRQSIDRSVRTSLLLIFRNWQVLDELNKPAVCKESSTRMLGTLEGHLLYDITSCTTAVSDDCCSDDIARTVAGYIGAVRDEAEVKAMEGLIRGVEKEQEVLREEKQKLLLEKRGFKAAWTAATTSIATQHRAVIEDVGSHAAAAVESISHAQSRAELSFQERAATAGETIDLRADKLDKVMLEFEQRHPPRVHSTPVASVPVVVPPSTSTSTSGNDPTLIRLLPMLEQFLLAQRTTNQPPPFASPPIYPSTSTRSQHYSYDPHGNGATSGAVPMVIETQSGSLYEYNQAH